MRGYGRRRCRKAATEEMHAGAIDLGDPTGRKSAFAREPRREVCGSPNRHTVPTLLRIDSSSRVTDSVSRAFGDEIAAAWRDAHPSGEVVVQDLVAAPVPHIHDGTIRGFYAADPTPADREHTALSDRLVTELLTCDALLVTLPMYNFSIPSALKAYIDQVVRAGRTFAVDPDGSLRGLVADRPVYLAIAKGAPYTGTSFAGMDFTESYLQALFGFLGLQSVETFAIEGTTIAPEVMERSRAACRARLATLLPSGE